MGALGGVGRAATDSASQREAPRAADGTSDSQLPVLDRLERVNQHDHVDQQTVFDGRNHRDFNHQEENQGSFGTQELGQISIARFNNPSGLKSVGNNMFVETPASGAAELGTPGENGFGSLAQGYLEMSNVKVVEEMVNLIVAQRAYEVNAKAVQAADEMMHQSNNLRR